MKNKFNVSIDFLSSTTPVTEEQLKAAILAGCAAKKLPIPEVKFIIINEPPTTA